jgi:hypothetical protein
MLLQFADGEPFATGAAPYSYRPVTLEEATPRIILDVAVGDFETSGCVDTGGVYAICNPVVLPLLGLKPEDGVLVPRPIHWRGVSHGGRLYRVPLNLLAEEGNGNSLTIEVTALIPDLKPNEEWPDDFPCFLGMHGCLEFLRFAVDPNTDTFYFGEFASL